MSRRAYELWAVLGWARIAILFVGIVLSFVFNLSAIYVFLYAFCIVYANKFVDWRYVSSERKTFNEVLRLRVGDIVMPAPGQTRFSLHCGTGFYSQAIVVSVYPLVLVSEAGDMRWSHVNACDIRAIETADNTTLLRCLNRYYLDKKSGQCQ
jgi:hypothetical protein